MISSSRTSHIWVNPSLGTPTTKGIWRECYENARREFWAQRKLGYNPEYHVGYFYGIDKFHYSDARDCFLTNPNTYKVGVQHAWVVVHGNIIDPTPQKTGNTGNTYMEPDIPAQNFWKLITYSSAGVIKPSDLKKKLPYFPQVDYINWQCASLGKWRPAFRSSSTNRRASN